MPKSRAAYMREYRKRRKGVVGTATTMDGLATLTNRTMAQQAGRIADLEAEVARLKRALAQANRDAILRKVNR